MDEHKILCVPPIPESENGLGRLIRCQSSEEYVESLEKKLVKIRGGRNAADKIEETLTSQKILQSLTALNQSPLSSQYTSGNRGAECNEDLYQDSDISRVQERLQRLLQPERQAINRDELTKLIDADVLSLVCDRMNRDHVAAHAANTEPQSVEASSKQETVEASSKQETVEASSKQETVEASSKQETVEASSRQETVEASSKQETVEASSKQETVEASSKQETVEASSKQETVEASSKQETVEVTSEKKTVEASSKQETVEVTSEKKTVEASSEKKTVDASSEEKTTEMNFVPESPKDMSEHETVEVSSGQEAGDAGNDDKWCRLSNSDEGNSSSVTSPWGDNKAPGSDKIEKYHTFEDDFC